MGPRCEAALIVADFARVPGAFAGPLKASQRFGMFLKKLREIGQHFNRRRAQMMFDAFNILPLRFRIQSEE